MDISNRNSNLSNLSFLKIMYVSVKCPKIRMGQLNGPVDSAAKPSSVGQVCI